MRRKRQFLTKPQKPGGGDPRSYPPATPDHGWEVTASKKLITGAPVDGAYGPLSPPLGAVVGRLRFSGKCRPFAHSAAPSLTPAGIGQAHARGALGVPVTLAPLPLPLPRRSKVPLVSLSHRTAPTFGDTVARHVASLAPGSPPGPGNFAAAAALAGAAGFACTPPSAYLLRCHRPMA